MMMIKKKKKNDKVIYQSLEIADIFDKVIYLGPETTNILHVL